MTSTDERFRPAARLRRRSEFKRVERTGVRRVGSSLILYAAPSELDWSRVGITVTRKVGNATRRNRWKRRLREIYRRNKDDFPVGWDFVVIVKRSVTIEPTFDALQQEMLTLMNDASAPK